MFFMSLAVKSANIKTVVLTIEGISEFYSLFFFKNKDSNTSFRAKKQFFLDWDYEKDK